MTNLTANLNELLDFLESRVGVLPSRDVRIIEIGPEAATDERGRLRVNRKNFLDPKAYEPRFDMLMKQSLPWINITCYGFHDNALVVGVELPRPATRRALRTSVNYSGPPVSVIREGWDVTQILAID